MKYFPLLLGLFFLSFACTDRSSDEPGTATIANLLPDPFAQDTHSYRPIFYHQRLPENLVGATPTPLGSFGPILQPNLADPITQMLTGSTYWVFEFYHDGAAAIAQRKQGKGIWFQFKTDGTYNGGHWDHWTHSGVWHIQPDGTHNYLVIDSNVDRHDATWDVQGLSADQTEMGWARTNKTGFQKEGRNVQGKLIRLFTAPTKEQFGIVE
ncbi:MAG: hypothetical protein AAF433_04055 [Bacteroidota bacterium]